MTFCKCVHRPSYWVNTLAAIFVRLGVSVFVYLLGKCLGKQIFFFLVACVVPGTLAYTVSLRSGCYFGQGLTDVIYW